MPLELVTPETLRRDHPAIVEMREKRAAEIFNNFEKGKAMDINSPLIRDGNQHDHSGRVLLAILFGGSLVGGFAILAVWDTIAAIYDSVVKVAH